MSDVNLFEASNQWATRPDDERFESLQAMRSACKAYADSAVESSVRIGDMRVEAGATGLQIVGGKGIPATLTHYAFGQLARYAQAPAGYLRTLPKDLAATCVNTGLKALDPTDTVRALFHKNGHLVTRAITSERYDRVWNFEVVDRIIGALSPNGWVVPPARPARAGQRGTRIATEADILPNQGDFGLRIKVGDPIAPAGLYASDHDMFAFLVNQIDPVWDGAKFLNRGVFIQNSEVGDCALKFKLFTYDNVCGNHIVWGVGEVTDVSVRHIKGAYSSGQTLANGLRKWRVMAQRMPTAGDMSKGIAQAKAKEIAATKEQVLDAVFKFAKAKSLNTLTRDAIATAYQIAENTPRYGAPTTVWGMVNGLTEYSQQAAAGKTDLRTEIDVQAGRVMEMAF